MRALKKLIAVLSVAMIFTVGLSGCNIFEYQNIYGYPGYENLPVKDGFKYWDDGAMYLMGITDEAVDADGIVEIPKAINGKKVTQLGWWAKNHVLSDNGIGGFNYCEGIKEVKLPSTVEKFVEFLGAFCHSTVKITANFGKNADLKEYKSYFDVITVYPVDLLHDYKNIGEFIHRDVNGGNRIIANIYFEKNPNEENEYHYAIDYAENRQAIRKPKNDPIRPGYEFTGWYKELECKTLWDFQNDKVELTMLKESGEDVETYREYLSTLDNYQLSLYAGWRKV